MKSLFLLPVLALSATLLAAEPATPPNPTTPPNPHAGLPNPHTGMKMPAVTAPQEIPLTQQATVISTINVPQFTYIEAMQDKKTIWLATSSTTLKKGDVIRFDDGAIMENFYSKTLKRNFPSILFVNRVVVSGDKK
jgi:hypothetical protein